MELCEVRSRCALLGDRSEAISWLERSVRNRLRQTGWREPDSNLDSLRTIQDAGVDERRSCRAEKNPLKPRVGGEGRRGCPAPSGFILRNRGWFFLARVDEPRGWTPPSAARSARLGGPQGSFAGGPSGICCCCMEFHALCTANERIGVPLERQWRKMPNSHDQWGACR